MKKKIVSLILALASVLCCSFAVACTNDNGGNSQSSQSASLDYVYTVTLHDQENNAIKDVSLSLVKAQEVVAEGVTDAEGKVGLEAPAGEYVLKIDGETLPLGFIPDYYSYTVEITADGENAKSILVEDMNPNGTEGRPYSYEADDDGVMQTTLAAGATQYYIVYRSGGRLLTVENESVKLLFNGNEYTPVAGKIETTLLGSEGDYNTASVFALVNTSAEKISVRMVIIATPGAMENPIPVTLGENVTVTVAPRSTVYYEYVATVSGTLVITSTSDQNNICMYNEQTYVASDYSEGALTSQIAVNEGDVIRIDVSIIATATEATEISFSLSMN